MRSAIDHPKEPSFTQSRENHQTAPLANQEHVFPDLPVKKKHIFSQEALQSKREE
jgi:hypothetical protein